MRLKIDIMQWAFVQQLSDSFMKCSSFKVLEFHALYVFLEKVIRCTEICSCEWTCVWTSARTEKWVSSKTDNGVIILIIPMGVNIADLLLSRQYEEIKLRKDDWRTSNFYGKSSQVLSFSCETTKRVLSNTIHVTPHVLHPLRVLLLVSRLKSWEWIFLPAFLCTQDVEKGFMMLTAMSLKHIFQPLSFR